MQPYRTPPREPPVAEDAPAEVVVDEDAVVHALVFVVGAIGVATAIVDSTQTTAGALGALAMLVALWLFVRERRRARSESIVQVGFKR